MITQQGKVLEKLLSGDFICQVSDEDAWHFLNHEEHRVQVEKQLNILNRTLGNSGDGEVYFCGYHTLGDEERRMLSSQFQDISSSLIPLAEWLMLVQEATGSDMPLSQGNSIRLNELQSIIEDTPALSEEIAKISRYKLFGSQSQELDGQLKLVFKRLVDLGYLLKPNAEKQIYLVTGKVDYLFEVIKFIDETEALALSDHADDAMTQTSLL